MTTSRRDLLRYSSAAAGLGSLASAGFAEAAIAPKPFANLAGPRSRTIFLNDLSGDPDGLFAAAHQILSTATELRAIVGTGTGAPGETAERSAELGGEMLKLAGRAAQVKAVVGASGKITSPGVPVRSPGTQAIIDEALRTDTQLPLYVAVGGGLTEVASALMIAPQIADRFTLVWIGGEAYPAGGWEYNLNIDALAAQFIFNETAVRIWQVPRPVYGTCVVSVSELQAFVAPNGAIGDWLYGKLMDASQKFGRSWNTGETWTLGDSPLVVLTALQDWVPGGFGKSSKYERTGSSAFDDLFAPRLGRGGAYEPRSEGRKIRAYKSIDTRLMFNDFFAKLRLNSGRG
jgi:hypothetical protein